MMIIFCLISHQLVLNFCLNKLQQVTVETLEKGFLINVYSEKNCPGLLVSILEAFERLGLEVLDARVSCSNNYRLEAVSEVMNYLQSYRNLR